MEHALFIALDFPSRKEVVRFLGHFPNEKLFLKVGIELFYQEGPKIIDELKNQGHFIFLDLKLHDIPNTVKHAMKGLARLGCDLVNVHASGGREMMMAAIEGLEEGTVGGRKRPYCIAVTQLTSTSEEQMKREQLVSVSLKESVIHYARLAKEAGLDGVVCSGHEVETIYKHVSSPFITVTPGIRLQEDRKADQKRVATPQYARKAGATAIVVGRGITKSPDPLESYYLYKKAWEGEAE